MLHSTISTIVKEGRVEFVYQNKLLREEVLRDENSTIA
jgi:hypothetical protein